jgi:hypothetical protein
MVTAAEDDASSIATMITAAAHGRAEDDVTAAAHGRAEDDVRQNLF